MFVVVQFPVADGRRFVDLPDGYLRRPSWKAPQAGIVSEYVWGFGRVVRRTAEVDPAWTDEACYALARSSLRLPGLVQRQVKLGSGAFSVFVVCAFRRLFHDGTCVARVEVGFRVRSAVAAVGPLDAATVVEHVLTLPTVVPESGTAARTRQLALQGSSLAGRYRDASTPRAASGAGGLVAAGNPAVLVDTTDDTSVTLPTRRADASAATTGRIALGFALTRFGGSGVPTWYIGPDAVADTDLRRNLRICLLRLHAEEEVLDRVVSWVDGGDLVYRPKTDAAGRLDDYIDRTTQLLERRLNYGLPSSALREAYDAVTQVNRRDVDAQRRAAFDGMRLQVRRKAEAFIARRDALRPQIAIGGSIVNENINVNARDMQGVQIGSGNTQTITDSFKAFAVAHGQQDDLLASMNSLTDSVTALVAALEAKDPGAAKEVAETFQSFTEESAKAAPKAGTLRALGSALVDAAKKVADVAVPVATAVSGVLRIFGIPVPLP